MLKCDQKPVQICKFYLLYHFYSHLAGLAAKIFIWSQISLKITKEAFRDKFQMRFLKKTCKQKARIDSNH